MCVPVCIPLGIICAPDVVPQVPTRAIAKVRCICNDSIHSNMYATHSQQWTQATQMIPPRNNHWCILCQCDRAGHKATVCKRLKALAWRAHQKVLEKPLARRSRAVLRQAMPHAYCACRPRQSNASPLHRGGVTIHA